MDSGQLTNKALGLTEPTEGQPTMAQESNSGYSFLIKTIEGGRHPDFLRVKELQVENTALSDGNGYASLLSRYELRESSDKFEKRKALTNPITPEIITRNIAFLKRLYQQPKRSNELKAPKDGDRKLTRAVSRFGDDGESLLKWVEGQCLMKTRSRPNDFVFVDYDAIAGKFEPMMLYCESVLNFKKSRGAITDLVYLRTIQVGDATTLDQYMYLFDGGLVYFTEAPDLGGKQADSEYAKKSAFLEEIISSASYKGNSIIKGKTYAITETQLPGLPPVFSFGYLKTSEKGCDYFVPFWDDVRLMLLRAVSDGSKLDVTEARHAFPKGVEYVDRCRHVDPEKGACVNGSFISTGEQCPNCNGTGRVSISDEHDILQLPLPESSSKDYAMPMKPHEIRDTVEAPISTLQYLAEKVNRVMSLSCQVIFGVDPDHNSNGGGAVTATQVLNHQGTSNAAIAAYSALPERMYTQIVDAIANYLGLSSEKGDYAVSMQYSKDMTFASERDLIDTLSAAKTAGASPSVLKSIEKRLHERQQWSYSVSVRNEKAIEAHRPFSSLSESLAATVVMNLPSTHPTRLLWQNFAAIASQLAEKNTEFSELKFSQQSTLVEEVVEEYVKKESERQAASLSSELEGFMDPQAESDED